VFVRGYCYSGSAQEFDERPIWRGFQDLGFRLRSASSSVPASIGDGLPGAFLKPEPSQAQTPFPGLWITQNGGSAEMVETQCKASEAGPYLYQYGVRAVHGLFGNRLCSTRNACLTGPLEFSSVQPKRDDFTASDRASGNRGSSG